MARTSRTAEPVRNALDGIADAFAALCDRSDAPAIDGTVFGAPLPARPISLVELKDLLLQPATPFAVRNAVWAELIVRTRTFGHEWTIGAAGMAMPLLIGTLNDFREKYPDVDVEELAADLLTGFLAALKTVAVDEPGILCKVQYAVFRAARRSAYVEAFAARSANAAASAPPAPGFGHVDLVLARAVEQGVVDRDEADVICATRLDRHQLADVAEALGTTANALRMRRRKAEARLAAWLTDAAVTSRATWHQGRTSESPAVSDRFRAEERISGSEAATRRPAA